MLWQVLEELGIHGRVLDIIKSLYAHDCAALRSSQGISAIFRCLLGVKQGCPLSPTLFGLYVDGLEKHLRETADIDAPHLFDALVPLLLYADDLILISTSAAGLQRQLDALQGFCQQRQLTVNLTKTKVVVFEASKSECVDFVFNGRIVEQVESYRYLGFHFHATKNMSYGVSHLVSAARKAVHAMKRRCAHLHIRDPAMQCRLFNSLVLPILSYASEVWAVDPKLGEAAEKLHRQFLKQLLHIRNSTATEIVLAEFGRYPLQVHFWQQILRFHNWVLQLDNSRYVKLALVYGAELKDNHVLEHQQKGWRSFVSTFLATQPRHPCVFQNLDVSAILDNLKEAHRSALLASDGSTVKFHNSLQLEYNCAAYLSSVQSFDSRRLISRFRCGCHGLHVDTGRWAAAKLSREDRVCQVCHSLAVEDEQHFFV